LGDAAVWRVIMKPPPVPLWPSSPSPPPCSSSADWLGRYEAGSNRSSFLAVRLSQKPDIDATTLRDALVTESVLNGVKRVHDRFVKRQESACFRWIKGQASYLADQITL
jgi:hypothetical protein